MPSAWAARCMAIRASAASRRRASPLRLQMESGKYTNAVSVDTWTLPINSALVGMAGAGETGAARVFAGGATGLPCLVSGTWHPKQAMTKHRPILFTVDQ